MSRRCTGPIQLALRHREEPEGRTRAADGSTGTTDRSDDGQGRPERGDAETRNARLRSEPARIAEPHRPAATSRRGGSLPGHPERPPVAGSGHDPGSSAVGILAGVQGSGTRKRPVQREYPGAPRTTNAAQDEIPGGLVRKRMLPRASPDIEPAAARRRPPARTPWPGGSDGPARRTGGCLSTHPPMTRNPHRATAISRQSPPGYPERQPVADPDTIPRGGSAVGRLARASPGRKRAVETGRGGGADIYPPPRAGVTTPARRSSPCGFGR